MLLEDYGVVGDLQAAALVGRNVPRARQVGNFLQAFSHLTLIDAARAISRAESDSGLAA